MKLRGDYAAGTKYNVGDVVRFTDGIVYLKQKDSAAGIPCTDTLYWGRLDQVLADAVQLIMDGIGMALNGKVANNLTTTASGKVLDARQGKALKDLIDALTGRVEDLEETSPDAKTIRLLSSTADSKKLFDITVDDDGEISATEFTPET